MRKIKHVLMEAFLKGHRRSKSKTFLGVIGNHFVEILDDDPFILKFLNTIKSEYTHETSHLSRFLPPSERMVLRSHEKNSLVIFKSEPHLEPYTCSVKLFAYHYPTQTPKALLTDAVWLAAFRWSRISIGDNHYPLTKSIMQHVEEILAALSSHKN